MAQATKAKFLEAEPFHQALETRVDMDATLNARWLERMGRPVALEATP
ncbi:hypothetical protein [Archangium sp.]|nr:hypothetical protein [Archangium sp.]HYO56907.1 hypothetical protein [Archangium sp.]